MNLRSTDLNLLVVLDALLTETSVTRAADRLGLSQPAASAALDRCRHVFGDPLLQRVGAGMRLTRKAEGLRAPLKSVLADVARLVDASPVKLADIQQRLSLSVADYPAVLVINDLQADLARSAPGIDLVVMGWQGTDAVLSGLADGSIDLAVAVLPATLADIQVVDLLGEHYVVAMRDGHPAAQGFDLAGWLAYPHIVVSGRGEHRSPIDGALAERGLVRRVGLVVPTFGMVPGVLAGSDMVALLPSRCVPVGAGIVVFEPPVPVPGFTLQIGWHRRNAPDPAVQHVAGVLRRLLV